MNGFPFLLHDAPAISTRNPKINGRQPAHPPRPLIAAGGCVRRCVRRTPRRTHTSVSRPAGTHRRVQTGSYTASPAYPAVHARPHICGSRVPGHGSVQDGGSRAVCVAPGVRHTACRPRRRRGGFGGRAAVRGWHLAAGLRRGRRGYGGVPRGATGGGVFPGRQQSLLNFLAIWIV